MTTTHSQPPSVRIASNAGSPVPGRPGISSIAGLVSSENSFAAGIGEVVQTFITSANAPSPRPIMVEFGNRMMAIGRQRMSSMNGRNAVLYLKSKFGLLHATQAVFLQATFEGDEEGFVEIDLDSWEELVLYMKRLRIIS